MKRRSFVPFLGIAMISLSRTRLAMDEDGAMHFDFKIPGALVRYFPTRSFWIIKRPKTITGGSSLRQCLQTERECRARKLAAA